MDDKQQRAIDIANKVAAKTVPTAQDYGRGITEIFNAPGQKGRSFTNQIQPGASPEAINTLTQKNLSGLQGAWRDPAMTEGITLTRDGGTLRTGAAAIPLAQTPAPNYASDYAIEMGKYRNTDNDPGQIGKTVGVESLVDYASRRKAIDEQTLLDRQTKDRSALTFDTGIKTANAKIGLDEANTKKNLAEADKLTSEAGKLTSEAAVNRFAITSEGIEAKKKTEKGASEKSDIISLKSGRNITMDDARQAYLSIYGKPDGQGGFYLPTETKVSFQDWINQQATQPVFTTTTAIDPNLLNRAEEQARAWVDQQADPLRSDSEDFKQYGGNRAQALAEKTKEFYSQLGGQPAGISNVPPAAEQPPATDRRATKEDVKAAFRAGKISREQAREILSTQFAQ